MNSNLLNFPLKLTLCHVMFVWRSWVKAYVFIDYIIHFLYNGVFYIIHVEEGEAIQSFIFLALQFKSISTKLQEGTEKILVYV